MFVVIERHPLTGEVDIVTGPFSDLEDAAEYVESLDSDRDVVVSIDGVVSPAGEREN